MARNKVDRKTVDSSIDSFKAAAKGDFARPNLFEVLLRFPGSLRKRDLGGSAAGLSQLGRFTVRAANLPSSQMGVVEVPFRGRVLKIAGDRTFEPWTITIMNDTGFSLRHAFENWFNNIQAASENFTSIGGLGNRRDTQGYFADMEVAQLSRDGALNFKSGSGSRRAGGGSRGRNSDKTTAELARYEFINVFPSNISAIDLDYGSNDAIEEFTVELQVQYFQPKERRGARRGGRARN